MKNKIVLLLFLMFAFLMPNIKASSCEEGSFKVVYNANGGKGASSATCVSSTLSTIKPTRSGYKFLGWAKSKKATSPIYNAGDEVELTEDTTLYAVWSKGYKIKYNANGGKVSSKTKTVYKGLTYGTLKTPTRKGYKFLGWYTKASGGVNVTKDTKVTKSSTHTLYAHWQKIKYKITYELNGGSNSKKNKTSYYVTTSRFKLNSPTKKGYKFLGWYTSNKYKTKVTYVNKGTTGNKTYYAKWTPIKYTIQYYGNGNTSGSTKKQTSLKYNKTYTLNSNGFKKKDYVFDSWNTKKDGSGKKYTNKQSIKNLTSTNGKTIKLYARWKRREYTITYELNGGVNPSNAYKKYTKVSTLTLKTPTREGYTFKGWYTSSSFKTKVTKIKKGTTGNKKFYAKWGINGYSINYELNGGNLSNPTTNYTTEDNVKLLVPTREGYAFKGWYTDSAFNNQITEITKGTTGNLTLYAKWENLVSYKITYELNGGINSKDAVTTYTNDQKIVLSEPTRSGYKFLGWYTESTFENRVTSIEKGSNEDKTFYAKWELAIYNITYNLNGGENPNDIVTSYTINDNIVLPTPTRKGYEFIGWYTESSFKNKVTSIEEGSTEDKTFYAKWTAIKYTIIYNLNEGINPENAALGFTVEDEVTLSIPTKSGYEFVGWYTESTFENKIEKIEKGTTKDITLYAKWETITNYTIEYNLDGGVNPSNAVTSYTAYEEVLLPTPTKSGYTFKGWYTESTFVNKIEKIEKGTTGNKILYAKWQKGSLTRSYDYAFYNYNFDDKLTSLDDIKNTLFNIMNQGYKEYTVYCEYDNLQDCFDDYNKVTSDADLMKSISDYINPFYNFQTYRASRWSNGKIEMQITYSYSDDYQGINNYKESINNKIDEVISKYNITNLSDEEKISVFHDYIVNNTVYDIAASETDPEENKSSFTAYGALINGSAVCQGYADAMAIFLDRFGIPNLKVSSATHTWNLIYINGKWLHLDATWDDPVTSNGSQILLRDYYLVNTNKLLELDTSAHTFNQNLYLETK